MMYGQETVPNQCTKLKLPVLHCSLLNFLAMCCTFNFFTNVFCSVFLHWTAYVFVLDCTALHCTELDWTALDWTGLQYFTLPPPQRDMSSLLPTAPRTKTRKGNSPSYGLVTHPPMALYLTLTCTCNCLICPCDSPCSCNSPCISSYFVLQTYPSLICPCLRFKVFTQLYCHTPVPTVT